MPDEQKEKIGARLKAFVRRSGLSQAESGQAQGNASVTPVSYTHLSGRGDSGLLPFQAGKRRSGLHPSIGGWKNRPS